MVSKKHDPMVTDRWRSGERRKRTAPVSAPRWPCRPINDITYVMTDAGSAQPFPRLRCLEEAQGVSRCVLPPPVHTPDVGTSEESQRQAETRNCTIWRIFRSFLDIGGRPETEIWRKGWDSNPRGSVTPCRFSRPVP